MKKRFKVSLVFTAESSKEISAESYKEALQTLRINCGLVDPFCSWFDKMEVKCVEEIVIEKNE